MCFETFTTLTSKNFTVAQRTHFLYLYCVCVCVCFLCRSSFHDKNDQTLYMRMRLVYNLSEKIYLLLEETTVIMLYIYGNINFYCYAIKNSCSNEYNSRK